MSSASGAEILNRIVHYIVDPAIMVVFGAGLVIFIWGLLQFLWNPEDTSRHDTGVRHMLWGLAGMLIMVSVYGIVALIDNTLGIDIANPDTSSFQTFQ